MKASVQSIYSIEKCPNSMSILKQITIKPVVSVIIPLYNSETTIQRTMLSLLGQPNGKEIEIIVIDDGSTDENDNC